MQMQPFWSVLLGWPSPVQPEWFPLPLQPTLLFGQPNLILLFNPSQPKSIQTGIFHGLGKKQISLPGIERLCCDTEFTDSYQKHFPSLLFFSLLRWYQQLKEPSKLLLLITPAWTLTEKQTLQSLSPKTDPDRRRRKSPLTSRRSAGTPPPSHLTLITF